MPLIKICNAESGPVEFTVGDVTIKITRLAGRSTRLSIDAPAEMRINFKEGTTLAEAVENAMQPVVEGPDDNA